MRQDPKKSVTDPELQTLFERVIQSAIKSGKGIEHEAFGIRARCEEAGDGSYVITYEINHEEVKKALDSSPLATASKMCFFWLMGAEIFKHENGAISVQIDGREHQPGDKSPRFRIERDALKWVFKRVEWT